MNLPQYVTANQRTVAVVGMIPTTTEENENPKLDRGVFIDGKGYIDNEGSIWIYCGAGKPKNQNAYPYFWFKENTETGELEMEFADPPENIRDMFNTINMKDMSLVSIIEKTVPGEKLFDENEINDINAAAEFFIPTIYETDDFLKKIVKTTIIEKGIDINRLKCKTEQKYILPNMKAALQNKTKMSVVYFIYWMELLGCDFEVAVMDNETDVNDPLRSPLVYQSNKDTIGVLVNGNLGDLNKEKYTQIESKEED